MAVCSGSARRPRLFCIGDEQNSGYEAPVSRAGKSAFNVRMNPEGDVHTVFPPPIGKFGGPGSTCFRAGSKDGPLGPGIRPRAGRGATGLGWTTGPRHWQLPSINMDFPAKFAP